MYNNRLRESAFDLALETELSRQYGITSIQSRKDLEGFYGEIWEGRRMDERYFIKLNCAPKHQTLMRRNLPALRHLRQNGVRCVPSILPTHQGELSIPFGDGTLAVYSFLPGGQASQEHFPLIFQSLAEAYLAPPSTCMRRETFDLHVVDEVFIQLHCLATLTTEAGRSLHHFMQTKTQTLSDYGARLACLAWDCKRNPDHFVITHGDVRHNALIHGQEAYLIDWDDPLYAPPERDAWLFLDQDRFLRQFEETLQARGMDYKLRPERLAFYSYYMFFQFLRECLACFFDMQDKIDPWILEKAAHDYFDYPALDALHIVEKLA